MNGNVDIFIDETVEQKIVIVVGKYVDSQSKSKCTVLIILVRSALLVKIVGL
jgi:hypothetical protein